MWKDYKPAACFRKRERSCQIREGARDFFHDSLKTLSAQGKKRVVVKFPMSIEPWSDKSDAHGLESRSLFCDKHLALGMGMANTSHMLTVCLALY